MNRPGLSGISVAVIGAGMLLIYSAVGNASVSDTLRSLLRGEPLPSKGSTLGQARQGVQKVLADAGAAAASASASQGVGTASDTVSSGIGTALGSRIADRALAHVGAPYVFGTAGPNTFDCSGLVTWVLHKELGLSLPSNSHTVTGQFYVWNGATNVARPPMAGDLICWTGHIGIAINETQMVHAPGTGQHVKVSNIWWTPAPQVRRVKPQ